MSEMGFFDSKFLYWISGLVFLSIVVFAGYGFFVRRGDFELSLEPRRRGHKRGKSIARTGLRTDRRQPIDAEATDRDA